MPKKKIELVMNDVAYACYRSTKSDDDDPRQQHFVIPGCGSVTLSATGEVTKTVGVGPHGADVLRKLAPMLAERAR